MNVRQITALALLGAAIACGPSGSFLGSSPQPPYDLSGLVFEDSRELPNGVVGHLAGVRVEVIEGAATGAVALTNASGQYVLPRMPSGFMVLAATKDGYDPHHVSYTASSNFGPSFTLGQPPHTLWGDVFTTVQTGSLIAGVMVEILGGSNGGRVTVTDDSGRYRFDGLVASPRFDLRITKDGLTPRTFTVLEFHHNEQRNLSF